VLVPPQPPLACKTSALLNELTGHLKIKQDAHLASIQRKFDCCRHPNLGWEETGSHRQRWLMRIWSPVVQLLRAPHSFHPYYRQSWIRSPADLPIKLRGTEISIPLNSDLPGIEPGSFSVNSGTHSP
jgi:hypothetical protein